MSLDLYDDDLGFNRKGKAIDLGHNLAAFRTFVATSLVNVSLSGGSGNTVEATQLRTTGDDVHIDGATAPLAGQKLEAFSPTAAGWDTQSQPQCSVFWDQKTSGTNGGTLTAGIWQTRDLNSSAGNIVGASLASNQITLPAGSYYISATAPTYQMNSNQVRFRNITDATTAITGIVARTPFFNLGQFAVVDDEMVAALEGFITIGSAKVFELQHQGTTAGGVGSVPAQILGRATGFGDGEVYGMVTVLKVA